MDENEVFILVKYFRIMANWTIEERRMIWNKGQIIPGKDPAMWRKDQCGAIIEWDKYGDRSSRYNSGWEIDLIKPDSDGSPDTISNSRPLQWYNNASRQNGKLICQVTTKEK